MGDNKSINIPKDAEPPNDEQPLNTPLIDETNVPAVIVSIPGVASSAIHLKSFLLLPIWPMAAMYYYKLF